MTDRLLSHDDFLDRIPRGKLPSGATRAQRADEDRLRIAMAELHQADYALTRFVRANCLVADDTNPTPLVVKGGFAVRHVYGGQRFSKDADIILRSPDLVIEGATPSLIVFPPGMRLRSQTLTESGKCWYVTIDYVGTDGKARMITCDLNERERALRLPPPRPERFASLFFDDGFRVWCASPMEIVAEKIAALLDERQARIRFIYDLWAVLAHGPTCWSTIAMRELLSDLLAAKGLPNPADVASAVREIADSRGASEAWAEQVIETMPGKGRTIASVMGELEDLFADWLSGRFDEECGGNRQPAHVGRPET